MHDVDHQAFAAARAQARAQARAERQAALAEAVAAKGAARQGLTDHAAELYADPLAGDRDADRLEAIAERLGDVVAELELLFDRLEMARDIVRYRGPVVSRARSSWRPVRFLDSFAEILADELLSPPAGALLLAAARVRAAHQSRCG